MKKLLALLLALFMPLCALAEPYGLSLSLETDEKLAEQFREALLADPAYAANADALAAALQQLLDGLGLDIICQEDAASLSLRLAGGTLLDMTVHTADDAAWLTTSMLPGYALKEDNAGSAADDQEILRQLQETDWTAVQASMAAAAGKWASVIEHDVSTGVYTGDAFDGGTQCATITLTDMDIAALVSALATEELRTAVTPLLTAAGLDAEDVLAKFDAANDRVADEDKYAYLLRLVGNDDGELVGLSLTIVGETAQVATLSLGLEEQEIRLVIGLGLKEQNYWWELTAKLEPQGDALCLNGTSREWVASKEEGFGYASAANAPVAEYTWQGSVTEADGRYLWEAVIHEGSAQGSGQLCSGSGSLDPASSSLDFTISMGGAENPLLTLNAAFGPTDAIAPLDSTLKVCSITDAADSTLYEKLVTQFSAALMARLLKLLPLDVIMTLNQLPLSE